MAGKSLSRLSKSLLDKPQLITLEKFKEISDVLENREYLNDPSLRMFDDEDEISTKEYSPYPLLKVEGPTTYKPTGWEALCGGCSYVSLIEQMEAYAEAGEKTVVMWIDSPGGQAYRMMSTARRLRKIADENEMHLVGYVDGQACSAAMGLGSVCHELIAHQESQTGSIGVVISLINDSKHLEKEGYERKFITAGASKVPFDDAGEFREGFLADLQADVDDLYTKFVNHVAEYRGMEVQAVKDTEARVFKAEEGLRLGLVDKIMEEEDFWEYLESEYPEPMMPKRHKGRDYEYDDDEEDSTKLSDTTSTIKGEETMSVDNTELLAQVEKLQVAMAAQTAQLEAYKQKEAQAEKAEIEEHLSSFDFVADMKEQLVTFMTSDASEDYKSMLVSVLGSAQAKIDSTLTELNAKVDGLQEKLTAAETEAANAKAEADKVIAEFGTKQDSVESTPAIAQQTKADGVDRTAQLAAIVARKKANK